MPKFTHIAAVLSSFSRLLAIVIMHNATSVHHYTLGLCLHAQAKLCKVPHAFFLFMMTPMCHRIQAGKATGRLSLIDSSVCVCVCVHICMYIRMSVCLSVCVCVCVCMYICMCVYMYMRMFMYVFLCMYMYMYKYKYMYMYMYMCMYMYVCVYVCI
jgi:hypothetical protein